MWVAYGLFIGASPVVVANLAVFAAAGWTLVRRASRSELASLARSAPNGPARPALREWRTAALFCHCPTVAGATVIPVRDAMQGCHAMPRFRLDAARSPILPDRRRARRRRLQLASTTGP